MYSDSSSCVDYPTIEARNTLAQAIAGLNDDS
jgi:hypothetical protein